MHGYISSCELIDLLCRATLFALTPVIIADSQGIDAEGFGLAYLEAALFGVPSIASHESGSAEAVVDGVTGVLVDPHAPLGVARSVTTLLGDPAVVWKMGEAARKRAELNFFVERSGSRAA